MVFSPVKELALREGIDVYQPEKLRTGEAEEILRKLNPDIVVVVAYGKIIPANLLSIPQYGYINVHGSILPKYRGAAPIQWAVLNGDEKTGVSTMYLDAEMDCGDVIYCEEVSIGETETSGELFDRLKGLGAELLVKTLDDIELGTAPRSVQNHSIATYTTKIDKTFCPIDFNKPARLVLKQIYGLQPWPVATFILNGKETKVFSAHKSDNKTNELPGKIISADSNGIEIACADGEAIVITEIQVPGKKRVAVSEFVKGNKILL